MPKTRLSLIFALALGFGFYFLWPWISGEYVFTWYEEPYVQAVKSLIRQTFARGELPLWNFAVGPGGSPGVLFSTVPWDYRLLLEGFWSPAVVRGFELGVLFLSFAFAFSQLIGLKLRDFDFSEFGAVVVGFLCFFTLDFVGYFFPFGNMNSTFLTFPVIAALVYSFERRPEPLCLFMLSLFFIFAFHGTKIETAFQLCIFTVCMMLAARAALMPRVRIQDLLCHKRGVYILGVVGLGVLSNFWQLRWIQSVISASGRMQAGDIGEGVWRFLLSFKYSSFLLLGIVLIGLQSLFMKWKLQSKLLRRNLWIWLLILLFVLLPPFPNGRWLIRDVAMSGSVVFFFALTYIAMSWKLWSEGNEKNEYWSFCFELPLLAVMVLHFVFDNASTMNWGETTIQRSPFPVQVMFAILPLLSFLSPYIQVRRFAVFSLLGLYLLRAHIQGLLILGGAVWHIQRDSFLYSFFIGVLITLGFYALAVRLPIVRRWGVAVPIIFALGFLPYARHHYFRQHDVLQSQERAHASPRNQLHEWLKNYFALKSNVSVISVYPDLLIPGALMGQGVQQIEFYESGLSERAKIFFGRFAGQRKFVPESKFARQCHLPFVWFPNNFLRTTPCPRDERMAFYTRHIYPKFDPFHPGLESFSISHVVDILKPSQVEDFERVATGIERAEDPHDEILLWKRKTITAAPAFVEGVDGLGGEGHANGGGNETLCRDLDLKTGESQAPTKPAFFGSNFKTTVSSDKPCLRIRIEQTRDWKFRLNGIPVKSDDPDSYFTYLNLGSAPESKTSVVEGRYFPSLPYVLLICLLLQALWLALGLRILKKLPIR